MPNLNIADLSIEQLTSILSGANNNTAEEDAAIIIEHGALHAEASLWAAGRFSHKTAESFDDMDLMFSHYLVAELAKLGWKVPSNG